MTRQKPYLIALAFLLGAALAALVLLTRPTSSPEQAGNAPAAEAQTDVPLDRDATFPSWDADCAALDELVAYVENACDPASEHYLEPAERIAVFDMDGTIISEKAPYYLDYMLLLYRVLDDPAYEATPEMVDLCTQIRSYAMRGEKNSDLSEGRHWASAAAFAGMTPEEFRAYVRGFLDTVDCTGFEGMTYGESLYLPMREVIAYLQANDFDVWMVSASQREIVRSVVEPLGIAPDHVIAADLGYASTGQGDEEPTDYTMESDEDVVLVEPLFEGCEKTDKVLCIAREIGRKPVLAFGNSSGDYAMLNYAEGNGGMGLLVIADDTEREYGNEEKSAEQLELSDTQQWTPISMRDDWTTIYGTQVTKTELPEAEEEELAQAA